MTNMEYKELDDFLYRPSYRQEVKFDWVFVGGLAIVFAVVVAITLFTLSLPIV